MQHRGFVEQDLDKRAYRAGPALAELGLASVREDGLGPRLRPHLERLRDELNETIQLVVLQGAQGLFIETVESHRPLRTASRVGVTVPAHCLSGGKRSSPDCHSSGCTRCTPTSRSPRPTPHSIATRDALEAELATVRERGYATNFGESEGEIGSIGIAVHAADGQPRAGLAVSGPRSRINDHTDLTNIVRAMHETARTASSGLA